MAPSAAEPPAAAPPPAASAPFAAAPSAAAPPASGGASPAKLGLAGLLLLVLNHVFNEFMDDSGLHVTLLTARMPPGSNATARASLRARAELATSTLPDPSGCGALRFELMEHRGEDAPFTAALVHWKAPAVEAAVLPAWLAAELAPVESTRRLTTVFPEVSRWKVAAPSVEAGEVGEVGYVTLLVQLQTWTLPTPDAADAFRRGWVDLGFNALGERGVVRCDLLEEPDAASSSASLRLVTRKVFRDAAALAAHEASAHYLRWRAGVGEQVAQPTESLALDTLHPRSSFHPFRSRWR